MYVVALMSSIRTMYTTGSPSARSSLDSLLTSGSSLPCGVKEYICLNGEIYASEWAASAAAMLSSNPNHGTLKRALSDISNVRASLPLNEGTRNMWEVKEEKRVIELCEKAESWLER